MAAYNIDYPILSTTIEETENYNFKYVYMNLHDQKATFEKQLQLALDKSNQLAHEIKMVKSKLKKLERLIKESESLNDAQ